MAGYNLPANVSASDPDSPWNQTREPVHNEHIIQIALEEVDEVRSSLACLDRRIAPKTYFGTAYADLQRITNTLKKMLGEEG